MNKKTIVWIIIAILVLVLLYLTFLKPSSTGQVISSAARSAKAAGSYGGMVGGC